MARPLRVQYEEAIYHVLSRGNKGEYIFSEDKDKEYLLEILKKGVEKYGIELYTYCIMGNHYHLLLSIPCGELTKFMHFIGSSYGSYLRRQRGWIGHIFAGRYKSLCVEKEGYLLELSRYIHLNPVRANIVKLPQEYQWSSYRYYIGKGKCPEWLNIGWLLEEYGKTLNASQRKYMEFVETGIENPPKYPAENIVGQAILGSNEFIKKVLKDIRGDRSFGEVTAKRIFSEKINLGELYKRVCAYYQLGDLKKEEKVGAEVKRSREMFIYLSKKYTSALNREISEKIGRLTTSGITRKYKRILSKIEGNKKLQKMWNREAEEIMSIFKG
ncbi:MAG: transposase [Nitrospirota bacterium]